MLFANTDVKGIMAELEERLLDECDYRKEAAYQVEFGRRFAGHPTIVVPRVHEELVSARVLVTTLHEGRSFYEWLASNPDDAVRMQATRTFYRFYLGSFYLDGLFNCDPHPGNYLFQDDGRIVFLDYGCCRRFPDERRRLWIAIAQATRRDDPVELEQAGRAIGFSASCPD
jgi:predicted unusual protein kinase regulating ubiquinone biosynthesis (AarF/ABC1/UbiB family)